MPCGSRPSMAARTRSGARNASEIVILTLRTLHHGFNVAADDLPMDRAVCSYLAIKTLQLFVRATEDGE